MPDRNAMVAPLSLSSVLTPDFETSLNCETRSLPQSSPPTPTPTRSSPSPPSKSWARDAPKNFADARQKRWEDKTYQLKDFHNEVKRAMITCLTVRTRHHRKGGTPGMRG